MAMAKEGIVVTVVILGGVVATVVVVDTVEDMAEAMVVVIMEVTVVEVTVADMTKVTIMADMVVMIMVVKEVDMDMITMEVVVEKEVIMVVVDMETIIMVAAKEVDMVDMMVVVDMRETTKFLLDQNKVKVVILRSQLVMDQRQELTAIMMLRLDQNQRTLSHNHHHQKMHNPIPKDLVEMVESE